MLKIKKILFLCIRGLGDTVIQSIYITSLIKKNPNLIFYIIGPENNLKIFKIQYLKNIIFIPYKVERNLTLLKKIESFIRFFPIAHKLKQKKIDLGIDLFGDYREILLFKFLPCKLFSIAYPKNHLFRKMVKVNPFLKGNYNFYPDLNINNYYEIIDHFFRFIKKKIELNYGQIYIDSHLKNSKKKSKQTIKIALNPFASVKSNNWPIYKWESLTKFLIQNPKNHIYIFYSSNDRNKMTNFFKHSRVFAQELSIEDYIKSMKGMDLSISCDSFSSHVGYISNTQNIIIYGSNNYKLFQPPKSIQISKSGGCSFHPCYNKPKCLNKPFQFDCLDSVTIEDVLDNIEN